jgi:hypothetical protein
VRTKTSNPSPLAIDIDPDMVVWLSTIVGAWIPVGIVGIVGNYTALVSRGSIDLLPGNFAQIQVADIDHLVGVPGFDFDFGQSNACEASKAEVLRGPHLDST